MGMTAQMPPGVAPRPAVTKAQHNPLPEGEDGLKILRAFSNCPIPEESAKLNKLLQMLLQNQTETDESADEILSKGLMAAMRANRYCNQNKKTRTVCIFAEDEKLSVLHKQIQDEQANLERLNTELEECVKRGNEVLQERWKKAVDTYGLNPDKYLYHIDEEKGIIEQMDLDCQKCKGIEVITKARTDATAKLMAPPVVAEAPVEGPREEPTNG
jgi:hypothetical protein